MNGSRGSWRRALALAASIALVVTHWGERGAWFWGGMALVALNLLTLWSSSRASVDDAGREPGGSDGVLDLSLADLLTHPGVVAAFAAGPDQWRQVSHLDEPLDPLTVPEVAAYVWIDNADGWGIGLADEMKPFLDLDLDEDDDPVISVLKGHPGVADAHHEDREVYRIEQRGSISAEEFAELAVRALVSHHLHVAAT